ncbi:4390_t:CDS:2, partial [Ambispora gerdemannii]
ASSFMLNFPEGIPTKDSEAACCTCLKSSSVRAKAKLIASDFPEGILQGSLKHTSSSLLHIQLSIQPVCVFRKIQMLLAALVWSRLRRDPARLALAYTLSPLAYTLSSLIYTAIDTAHLCVQKGSDAACCSCLESSSVRAKAKLTASDFPEGILQGSLKHTPSPLLHTQLSIQPTCVFRKVQILLVALVWSRLRSERKQN